MPCDDLDKALAFVSQSLGRLLVARVELLRTSTASLAQLERAEMAAAMTLDAACVEYNEQVRDMVKHEVMRAVAAMDTTETPSGAPYSIIGRA